MTGSIDYENKRHHRRRESDKILNHSEMRVDVQQCPMTPDSIDELRADLKLALVRLENIENGALVRLENIEKAMFAGRVAFRTVVVIGTAIALTFSWFRDNLSSIRDVLTNKP